MKNSSKEDSSMKNTSRDEVDELLEELVQRAQAKGIPVDREDFKEGEYEAILNPPKSLLKSLRKKKK